MTYPQQRAGIGHPYQLWHLPAVGESQYWVWQLVPAPGPPQNARTYSQYIRPIILRGAITLVALLIEAIIQVVVIFSTSSYRGGHAGIWYLELLMIPLILVVAMLVAAWIFMASKAQNNPVTGPLLGAAFGGVAEVITLLLLIVAMYVVISADYDAVSVSSMAVLASSAVLWIVPAALLNGSYKRAAKPVMVPGYIANWQFFPAAKGKAA